MNVINNNNFGKDTAKKLDTQQAYIYQPRTSEDWTYSHHQSIAFFKGRFYAVWSNGKAHEDFPGQRVMASNSKDAVNWEKPYPLLDTQSGGHIDATLTACGFYIHDGKIKAYIGKYEYDINSMLPFRHALYQKDLESWVKIFPSACHTKTSMLIMTSDDGRNFGDPVDTCLPIVPNHPPERLHSGRLLLCGNIMYPFTDDEEGLAGWRKAGIYPDDMAEDLYDDSEGLEIVKSRQGWATHRCEGSFFQLPDSTINMFLRSGIENNKSVLYCTRSKDNGESWSAPFATEFTNDTSKFHFGVLPDGRYYYVGNPVPLSGRCPLAISVSENGVDFDKHYIIENEANPKLFAGMHKGGIYGYPHTMVHGDRMYVIYSVNKESVAVSGFSLSDL